MKLPFRQGLVNYQVDGFGLQQFLQPSTTVGYVDLNVSPTPTLVSFAHGSSNYLQLFSASVPAAWGPIQTGVTSYLYWDIDLLTAAVSFGVTTLEPIAASTEPLAPPAPVGQAELHWFDTSTATMKVWTGAKWRTVVRAFAGQVNGSLPDITAEPRGQSWRGTLPTEGAAGYIATDVFNNPIRTLNGEFVTTATPVRFKTTSGTTGVLAVLPNAYVPVRASENIPAMSLVYFSGEGTVGLASGNPAINPPRIPIGVMQEALSINEVGAVTQSGEITYDQWDWSAHIGKPLYCGDSGHIVVNRPVGLLAYRIGFVKDSKTILFQVDAETLPQVYEAQASDVIVSGTAPIETQFSVNGLGERVWNVSIDPSTPATDGYMTASQAELLDDVGVRLTQAEADILNRALLGHTHTITDVDGLQVALDGKAPLIHDHDLQYAPISHNHDGYHALVVHTHTIPDVAGLQTELNNKVNVVPAATVGNLARFTAGGQIEDAGAAATDFAFANHTHSISHVTGLQTALDGKAPLGHTHTLGELTDVSLSAPVVDQVLRYDGTSWVNSTLAAVDDTVFTFQVGVPSADHLHYVPVLASQVRALIQGTVSSLPVGDVGQPTLVLVSDANGPSPHTHTLTVVYDYIYSTLRVVDISNNVTDQHRAYLVGSAKAPVGQVLYGSDLDGYTSSDYFRFDPDSLNFTAGGPTNQTALIATENFTQSGTNEGGNISLVAGSGDILGGNVVAVAGGGATGGNIELVAGNSIPGSGGDVTVSAGEGVEGGTIFIHAGAGTTSPGVVELTGGAGVASAFGGGEVRLTGGAGFDGLNPPQIILEGAGRLATQRGAIRISTGGVERIAITMDGAVEFDTLPGQPGWVLTSNGNGAPPTWQPVSVEGLALGDLSDVSMFYSPNNGDFLVFDTNSGKWEAKTVSRQIKPKPFDAFTISAPAVYSFGSALHHNWHVRSTSATDVEITIQPDSFWTGVDSYFDGDFNPADPGAMPIGGSILIGKHGTGNVTIVAAPGVTINTPDTLAITRLHGKAMLIKVGPNQWDLEGNIGV